MIIIILLKTTERAGFKNIIMIYYSSWSNFIIILLLFNIYNLWNQYRYATLYNIIIHFVTTHKKKLHCSYKKRRKNINLQLNMELGKTNIIFSYDFFKNPVGIFKLFLTHMCVRAIDFASFYDFNIWFWSCFDSVVIVILFYYCTFDDAYL